MKIDSVACADWLVQMMASALRHLVTSLSTGVVQTAPLQPRVTITPDVLVRQLHVSSSATV